MNPHYKFDDGGAEIAGSFEYFNRVLYGGHEKDDVQERFFTFAGDAPLFMGAVSDFTRDTWCYQAKNGVLKSGLALTPGHVEGGAKDNFSLWFHRASDIFTRWHNGYMSYELSRFSPYFPDVKVKMAIYPLNPGDGYAVEYEISSDQRVIFCAGIGGITPFFGRFEYYNSSNKEFSCEDCKDNHAELTEAGAKISGPCDTVLQIGDTLGCVYETDGCSAMTEAHPSMFLTSHEKAAPAVVKLSREIAPGEVLKGRIVVIRNDNSNLLEKYLAMPDLGKFLRNQARKKFSGRELHTPDGTLNSVFKDLITAQDAAFHGRSFYHGAVGYHAPFLGWRGWYAPTLLGWDERVKRAIESHFDTIMRSNGEEKVWWDGGDRPDLDHEGTQYHHLENSHGFLPALLHRNDIYDMQEVALDMTLHYLEYSGDMETAAKIIDRINEMLDWEERILDPDGDGLYQNFLNTWISDGHSYNGGACAQASCYNFRANRIAGHIAQKLDRPELAEKFSARAEKIKAAFNGRIWQEKTGVLAEFIDTIGNKLVHASPELSTLYLASECEIMDEFYRNYRSLCFAEREIKSVQSAIRKGRLYYSSNWLPKKYSTCGIFPAENAALALAFYRNFRKDKAFEIIEALLDGFELSTHPGAISHVFTPLGGEDGGDLDFTDVSSCVLRVLIEGMWGWQRAECGDLTVVAPQLPEKWKICEITLPAFKGSFHAGVAKDTYSFTLNGDKNQKHFILPLSSAALDGVMLNGVETGYSLMALPGGAAVKIECADGERFDFEIFYSKAEPFPRLSTVQLTVYPGNIIELPVVGGKIVKIEDHAGILEEIYSGVFRVNENSTAGFADIFIRAKSASGIEVVLPLALEVKNIPQKAVALPDGEYGFVELEAHCNAALTAIHEQEFLSPRPEGYSIGMRKNGRYAWEWNHFGHNALKVDDSVLRQSGGFVETPRGAKFKVCTGKKNAVTVSMWDNFPTRSLIPLPEKAAGKVKVLLCGTTNAMQSRVVNGKLTVICADGRKKVLELIHPVNFDDFLVPALQQTFEYFYIGEGTHAIVAEIPLEPGMVPQELEVEAVANEVVISILGVSCC
ncbi:MAG: hypothetical protein IJY46_08475 [Lentisphaeria bacterium]|nr:hypothetical protein [Lentisphaeria bacterium]